MSAGRSEPRRNPARPCCFFARSAPPSRKIREIERTNYWKRKIANMSKSLDKPPRNPARGQAKRRLKRSGWSPERRARQAELIRAAKPWSKSTGPKTGAGKTRSAANALKHGYRSRPFIERIREERRLVRLAAQTIALAKVFLGKTRSQMHFPPLRAGEVLSTISCEAEGGGAHPCLWQRPPP